MSELKPCPITPEEAIDILQISNAMLKSRIEEILALANDPTIIIPYDDIDYCKREYEAVELAIDALNHRAQPANEPLTLDELRGMDGEPVWIVFDDDSATWALVDAGHVAEELKLTTNWGGQIVLVEHKAHIKAIYRCKPEERDTP